METQPEKKIIRVECSYSALLPLEQIRDFQGNLKTLSEAAYQSLRQKIIDHGFSFPEAVWVENQDNEQAVVWCLDGHQRNATVKRMIEEEGFAISGIPVFFVKAKDRKEAKLKLLSAVAQFGKVTYEGLFEFAREADITLPEVESFVLPEIKFEVLRTEYYGLPSGKEEKQGSQELERKSFTKFSQECPKCGFSFDDNKKGSDAEA